MKFKVGDSVIGYEIVKELSGGGMSEVYLGKDVNQQIIQEHEFVIIKVISKNKIARDNSNAEGADSQWQKALDEFKLTWAIFEKPNPHIARPIKWDMGTNRDVIIIVTEFVDGMALSDLIRKQKALTIDRAIFYFKKICDGIRHLHQLNDKKIIIHRDLKSDNIMLSEDLRQIKIIDFGIATSFYDNAFETSEETIYCTANYTTSDILQLNGLILKGAARGESKYLKKLKEIITPQFDFHALGIILYEMLTGSFPFIEESGENDRQKIQKWLKFDIPVISNIINNVPNSIENIIFRLTASKDEDKKYRYKNIDEVISDLATWDDEVRKNEALIKPIDKRTFQQELAFDIDKLRHNEKFNSKWWFFITVNAVFFIILLIAILIVVFVGKI